MEELIASCWAKTVSNWLYCGQWRDYLKQLQFVLFLSYRGRYVTSVLRLTCEKTSIYHWLISLVYSCSYTLHTILAYFWHKIRKQQNRKFQYFETFTCSHSENFLSFFFFSQLSCHLEFFMLVCLSEGSKQSISSIPMIQTLSALTCNELEKLIWAQLC